MTPVTRLYVAESPERRLERYLRMLTECIADEAIPADVRKEVAFTHAALHRCRSAETVARLEREQGIQPNGDNAA